MLYRSTLMCGYVVTMVSAGCGPKYTPITLQTPDGGAVYTLTTSVRYDAYRTKLTMGQNDRGFSQYFEGKAEAMALSPNGDVLAVGLSGCDAKVRHRVVLLGAATLATIKQLPIVVPEVVREPDGYAPSIQRFDRLALSDDVKTLASYFWKPSEQGGHEPVVVLWDVETGDLLRVMPMPNPDASLLARLYAENVSSMVFSRGAAFLGVCGEWSIKVPGEPQPNGFIRVWRVSDGRDVATFRVDKQRFLRDMCFDAGGRHVAAWSWTGQGTQQSSVGVWNLPEGQKVTERVFRSRIRAIRWSDERDAFVVRHGRGEAYLPADRGTIAPNASVDP